MGKVNRSVAREDFDSTELEHELSKLVGFQASANRLLSGHSGRCETIRMPTDADF